MIIKSLKKYIIKKKKGIICYGHYKKRISKDANINVGERLYFNVYPYSKNQKAEYGYLFIGKNSNFKVKDIASFRFGCKLFVFNGANAYFGSNLFVNSNVSIFYPKYTVFLLSR